MNTGSAGTTDWLWQVSVQQTLQLTLLICCASLLVRFFGRSRPHLAHALWALVLLKCLTPPLVAFPLSPFSWTDTRFLAADLSPSPDLLSQSVEADLTNQAADFVFTPLAENSIDKLSNSSFDSPVEDELLVTARDPSSASPATNRLISVSRLTEFIDTSLFTKSILLAWLTGAIFFLARSIVQLYRFLRTVRRDLVDAQASTLELFQKTHFAIMGDQKTWLRIKPRLAVVDSLIGPAVVGLLRPRILLPRLLEVQCSSSELRMLLAHELVHIRRGDLFWATLQTLAGCTWWCHPLVRYVSARFDRETELSCDEETVATLRCSPAEYARSLLAVLERKHQLQAAPLLPGVRPMELTSTRMKRIMSLTTKANARRPWWIAALMLGGAIVALPGASYGTAPAAGYTIADEPQSPLKTEPKPWVAVPAAEPLPLVQRPADEGGDVINDTDDRPIVKLFKVEKILEKIVDEQSCEREQGKSMLLSWLKNLMPSGATIAYHENSLVACCTLDVMDSLTDEINRIHEYGFKDQVVVSTKIITLDAKQFESLDITWALVRQPEGIPVLLATLEPQQTDALVKTLQADPRTNIVQSPKITVFNGQSATISDQTERRYVFGPMVHLEQEGIELSICPVVKERYIELGFKHRYSTVYDMDELSILTADGENKKLQIPRTQKNQSEVKFNTPNGHTMIVAVPGTPEAGQMLMLMVTVQKLEKEKNQDVIEQVSASSENTIPVVEREETILKFSAARNDSLVSEDGKEVDLEALEQRIKNVSNVIPALAALNIRPFFTGDWQFETNDGRTILAGKNLLIGSESDDFQVFCNSGRVEIDPIAKRLTFEAEKGKVVQLDGEHVVRLRAHRIQVDMEGNGILKASGSQVLAAFPDLTGTEDLQIQAKQITSDGQWQIRGELKGQIADITFSADQGDLQLKEGLFPPKIRLSGNVQVRRTKDTDRDKPLAEGNSVEINLETREIQLYDARDKQ